MSRLPLLLLVLVTANAASALDRFLPVFTGDINGTTFRTSVDLRSTTTENCRFEVRAPNGQIFQSVETVEAGQPKVLDEFAAELRTASLTVMVSCSGAVDVHSRIHESVDGGRTYAQGSLFRAIVPEPLPVGKAHKFPVTADFIVAEVAGARAHVTGTLTATSSNRVADKNWDLPPFGERTILLNDVLRSLGPMEANLTATGEGQVVILFAITDPAFAKYAPRVPDYVRAQLNAQMRAAATPRASTSTVPPISRQLVTASFKAAPFQEPMTGLVYIRDRWYDPKTGTFMTPDPEGYRDSPNLYAYGKGDPVNNSDPTGRLVEFNGKDPWGDFFLFRDSLNNPAAAALLTLQGDAKSGYVLGLRPGVTKPQFLATAIPDPPTYLADLASQGIPLPKDRRSVEEKIFDMMSSMHVTEFQTGDSLTRLSSWPFSWFARTRTFPEKTIRYGGAMTLEPSETPSGNTAIAVNPVEINQGSAWTAAAAYNLAFDPQIATMHEFGHALAYHDNNVPCFQMWSVYLENQIRARRGERSFRTTERPLIKDPKTLICP